MSYFAVTGACYGEPRWLCWRELISMCIQHSGNCQICYSVGVSGTQNLFGVVGYEVGCVIWSKEWCKRWEQVVQCGSRRKIGSSLGYSRWGSAFLLQSGDVTCTFISYPAYFVVGTETLCVTIMIPPSPLFILFGCSVVVCLSAVWAHWAQTEIINGSSAFLWVTLWNCAVTCLLPDSVKDKGITELTERTLKQVCSCISVISCSSDCQVLQSAKIKQKYL